MWHGCHVETMSLQFCWFSCFPSSCMVTQSPVSGETLNSPTHESKCSVIALQNSAVFLCSRPSWHFGNLNLFSDSNELNTQYLQTLQFAVAVQGQLQPVEILRKWNDTNLNLPVWVCDIETDNRLQKQMAWLGRLWSGSRIMEPLKETSWFRLSVARPPACEFNLWTPVMSGRKTFFRSPTHLRGCWFIVVAIFSR